MSIPYFSKFESDHIKFMIADDFFESYLKSLDIRVKYIVRNELYRKHKK